MEPPYTKRSCVPINTCLIPNYFAPAESRNLGSILASKKGEIKIKVKNHFDAKRYRSGSVVEGTIDITPREQLRFGGITIKLVCDSSVETYHQAVSIETWHRLLDLDQPIREGVMPDSQVLQPSQTYSIPFHFVLPRELGTEACTHKVQSGTIRSLHSQPPPSLIGWERQVLVPKGIWLQYGIIAQVLDTSTPKYTKLAAKHTLQFLPNFKAQPVPPITTTDQADRTLSKGIIKNHIYSKTLAAVTLVVDEPQILVLQTSGTGLQSASIYANLYYDSLDATQTLPQTCVISADLKSFTWSKSEPSQDWPHVGGQKDTFSSLEAVAKKAKILLSWTACPLDEGISQTRHLREAHSSTVEIPIRFRNEDRLVLPTFCSCLVTRIYRLQVAMKIATATLKLDFPVQIAYSDTV